MLFEENKKNGKKATVTHSRNKTLKANGYTGTKGFTEQINNILNSNPPIKDAINATVFNTTSIISDVIPAPIPKGIFDIKTDLKNKLPQSKDNEEATNEMKNKLENTVFKFGIKDKSTTTPTNKNIGGALPLPIKIPKPNKMKGGDAEFQNLVDTLEQKINDIVSHPILVKIKSLKADSVRELCKRTVIYKDLNRDSFYLTKDIMDIVMDFLFVDYTTLDVFKQIYYYYQMKMDEDKDSSGSEIPNNVIKQQIYTHSGIMKIINVLLNKFTYEQYYPDFVKTPINNPKQSLLEKDTEYHKEVHGKYNNIDIDMNFGDDHVVYEVLKTSADSEEDNGDIKFEEEDTNGGQKDRGQRGGEGEEATALAIATAIQSTTPPPAAVAAEMITETNEQTAEKTELKKILPTYRKYIYISRFMKLIEAFREINPTPETQPKDVNSLHVQKMLEMMIYNHLRSYQMVKQVLGLMINDYNTEFFEVLNYLVRLQNSKLISYLKINNYENPMRLGTELANYDHENIQTDTRFIIDYNRRYNVFVNNPNITENWRNTYFTMPAAQKGGTLKTDEVRTGLKTMALQYNDDDFPYYEKKNDKFYASEAVVAAAADKNPRGFTVEYTTDGDEVVVDVDSKDVKNEDADGKDVKNNSKKGGSDDENDNYSNEDFEDFEEFEKEGVSDQNSQPKYAQNGGATYKTLSKVAQYDKTYLFGRMNQIFLPHYSNEEVAQNMESIIDLITNPVGQKKLFTIGYGASGAGKTSSLIYLNKGALENREGIIIHLCNRLAAMGYKNAEIQTKEFFSSPQNSQFEDAMKMFSTDKENKQRIKYTQKPYADNANKNNPSSAKQEDLVLYTVERGPFYFKHIKNEQTQKEEFLCFANDGDTTPIGKNNNSTAPSVATTPEEKSPVNETELSIALSAALGNTVDAKGGDSELQIGGAKPEDKISDLFGNVHTYRTFEEYNIDGLDMVRFPHPQFDEKTQKQDPDMLVNLGKLLIYLIDTDRLVKATTNNPNSSRSHVLLFLKLTLEDVNDKLASTVDIIIGDFAGVENAFDCDAVSVSNFLAIQKDVVPRTLYYKYDAKNAGIDVIHGGGEKDEEFVKKENNAFAEDIYGNLNRLKTSNKLYKIEKNGDSTTTEFEVIGENPIENGDIMDYLLTYEGQGLMKVLSPKDDYTKLQKSLEWVGRYYKEFGNRIENYKSADDGSKIGENYLKITEHENDIKVLEDATDFTHDHRTDKITKILELYETYINPDDFSTKINKILEEKNKLSKEAIIKVESMINESVKKSEEKIKNIKNMAQKILEDTKIIGFNYEKYTNKDVVAVFNNFNEQLKAKGDYFTNKLSNISDIKPIPELNREVNNKINEEAYLIEKFNTYYSTQGKSSGIENIEYKLKSFLPESNVLIVVNDDSYIIVKSVQFDDIVFNTLDDTIGNIQQIEEEIQAIEKNKEEAIEKLENNKNTLNKSIVSFKNIINNNKKGIEYFMDYTLKDSEVNLDDNNYKKYFDNNYTNQKLTEQSFLSIVKNIEYTPNAQSIYTIDNDRFNLFTTKLKEELIEAYTLKLKTLKAIYDGNVEQQKRFQEQEDRNKILNQLQNIELEIQKFIKNEQSPLKIIINNIELEKIELEKKLNELKKYTQPNPQKTNEMILAKQTELTQQKNILNNLYITQNDLNINQTNTKINSYEQQITTELQNIFHKIQKLDDDPERYEKIQSKINDLKINSIVNNEPDINKLYEEASTNLKDKLYKNELRSKTYLELKNDKKPTEESNKQTYTQILEEKENEYNKTILKFVTDNQNSLTNIKTNEALLNQALSGIKVDSILEKFINVINSFGSEKYTVDNIDINEQFKNLKKNTYSDTNNNPIHFDKNQKTFLNALTNDKSPNFLYYNKKKFEITPNSTFDSAVNNGDFIKSAGVGPNNWRNAMTYYNDYLSNLQEYLQEKLKNYNTAKVYQAKTTKQYEDAIDTEVKNIKTKINSNQEIQKLYKQNEGHKLQVFEDILTNADINDDNKSINDLKTRFNKNQNGGNPLQKGGANFLERYNKNIEAIKLIKAQIDLLYKYYQYGQKVCENRKKEGVFINQSLEEVRKTIQEILVYNADGSIETTPDFIEDCLKLYCPSGKDCFQMNQSAAKDAKIPSELFDAIFQHYKPTATTAPTETTPEDLKKKFYNELIVNIFCVFNITKSANNPPVVPYIDINALKRLFFNRNSIKLSDKRNQNDTKLATEIQKVLLNIAKYPKKLKELHDSKDIQLLAKQFLTSTGITIPYPPPQASDIAKTPFSSDLTKTQYDKLFPNPPTTTNITTTPKITDILKNNIHGMIELVDRTNAASVIGTLEFVDIMSKFGTTNNICSVDDINFEPEYIDVPPKTTAEDKTSNPLNKNVNTKFDQMKKVLQLHEISNYDFLNPHDNGAKQPVDFFQLLSDHYKYEQGTNNWDNPTKTGGATANKRSKRNKTAKHRIHGRKNQTEKNI